MLPLAVPPVQFGAEQRCDLHQEGLLELPGRRADSTSACSTPSTRPRADSGRIRWIPVPWGSHGRRSARSAASKHNSRPGEPGPARRGRRRLLVVARQRRRRRPDAGRETQRGGVGGGQQGREEPVRHRPADRGQHDERALQHDLVAPALDGGLDQQLIRGEQRVAVDALVSRRRCLVHGFPL